MSINGNENGLVINGGKLRVAGGIVVNGSIAYSENATGFGGVTAQIDNDNTLNITAGKVSGVAEIDRGTGADITSVNHTNVVNNTTIHIALKNTSGPGNFIYLNRFEGVRTNYTDDYVIAPGETGMLTLRKVNGVLSLFVREMYSTNYTVTSTNPFFIKDGLNYKYPLYRNTGTDLDIITINGTSYYRPTSGLRTKSRPPLGLPELIASPTGNLAIGNNAAGTTINYDVWGVASDFDFGSIYQGTTKKVSFVLENGEASGSFTESGASSGDAYSLYVERTDTSTSDTVSFDGFSGKTIPKLISVLTTLYDFNKIIDYTFNTQGSVDKITYKIESEPEASTTSGVFTVSYIPTDYGNITLTYAYATDHLGNKLNRAIGPYVTTLEEKIPVPGVKRWKYNPPNASTGWTGGVDGWLPNMHTYGSPTPTIVSTSECEGADYYWYVYTGWIESSSTRTYTLSCTADDDFYLWVGNNALDSNRSELTYSNAVCFKRYINAPTGVSNGTLSLTANIKTPIRMMFGENAGGELWTLTFDSVAVHNNLISTTVGSDTIKFFTTAI